MKNTIRKIHDIAQFMTPRLPEYGAYSITPSIIEGVVSFRITTAQSDTDLRYSLPSTEVVMVIIEECRAYGIDHLPLHVELAGFFNEHVTPDNNHVIMSTAIADPLRLYDKLKNDLCKNRNLSLNVVIDIGYNRSQYETYGLRHEILTPKPKGGNRTFVKRCTVKDPTGTKDTFSVDAVFLDTLAVDSRNHLHLLMKNFTDQVYETHRHDSTLDMAEQGEDDA